MSMQPGLRVLLVEDDMLVGMLLDDILQEMGCVVIGPVTSVGAALLLAAEAQVDVALLDINLAGTDVYPVAEVLIQRRIGFVFLTGYRAAKLGGQFEQHPSLHKPVDRAALQAAIEKLDPRRTQE